MGTLGLLRARVCQDLSGFEAFEVDGDGGNVEAPGILWRPDRVSLWILELLRTHLKSLKSAV